MIRSKFFLWSIIVFVNNKKPESFLFSRLFNALKNCEFLDNYLHLQFINFNEWNKKRSSYSLEY